jgi:hypothetical protein
MIAMKKAKFNSFLMNLPKYLRLLQHYVICAVCNLHNNICCAAKCNSVASDKMWDKIILQKAIYHYNVYYFY